MFPWVLWDVIADYWTWGGDRWNPQFVAKLTRSTSDLGTHYLRRASKVGSVLGDRSLNLWLWLQADGVRPELNCRSPSWSQRIGWCGGKKSHMSGVRSAVSREQNNSFFLSFSELKSSGTLPGDVWLCIQTTCGSLSQRCIWNFVWFWGL